jgi:hypothetical protein
LTSKLVVGGLALLISFVPMLLSALAMEQRLDEQGWVGQGVMLLLILLGVGLPAVLLLWLRSLTVARRELLNDLSAGRILLFVSPTENQNLEVLPTSQWLLRQDGEAVAGFERAEIYEATAPPAEAPRYAVPRSWQEDLDEGLSVERRRLSPAELSELAAHITRLKRPSFSLIFMAALLAVGLLGAWWMGIELSTQPLRELLSGLIWTFGLLLNLWFYGRDLRLARRLEIDRGNEWVVIYEEEDEDKQRATVEVLPASAAMWTESGHPSRWRQRARTRRAAGILASSD